MAHYFPEVIDLPCYFQITKERMCTFHAQKKNIKVPRVINRNVKASQKRQKNATLCNLINRRVTVTHAELSFSVIMSLYLLNVYFILT